MHLTVNFECNLVHNFSCTRIIFFQILHLNKLKNQWCNRVFVSLLGKTLFYCKIIIYERFSDAVQEYICPFRIPYNRYQGSAIASYENWIHYLIAKTNDGVFAHWTNVISTLGREKVNGKTKTSKLFYEINAANYTSKKTRQG